MRVGDGGGWLLFPMLTEGGPSTPATELKFNYKKNGGEKTLGMGEKNRKITDKLILAGFSTWFASGGRWQQAVIPLVE